MLPSERSQAMKPHLVLRPSAGRGLWLSPSTTETMIPSRLPGTPSARIITRWLSGPRGSPELADARAQLWGRWLHTGAGLRCDLCAGHRATLVSPCARAGDQRQACVMF